jgi:HEAT repeat protein
MQSSGQTIPAKPRPSGQLPPWNPPPELLAEQFDGLNQAQLVQFLKDPKATPFQKAKSCQRLAVVGNREAVPALAALLKDEKLGVWARFGLQPIADPSVDDAFRNALAEAKGGPLVGIINSIAYRNDVKAVPALAKLLYNADSGVAEAAAWALGKLSGPQSAKALQDGLSKTKGPARTAVAAGGLLCAEGLLAQGDRAQALALYAVLSRTDMPKPIRHAAMQGTIAAEISLSRPR